MSSDLNTVRLIRVFVSSPGDVREERAVMDEVVASINRTDGRAHGFRLELFRWEDVTPQIGPNPQQVVDDQTPVYDIYLGIMSTRFGTPTGRYGSGTQKEFKDAVKRWKKNGQPWITFYFNAKPDLSAEPDEVLQYAEVCKFRKSLEKQGIIATYTGVRGSDQGFYEKVSEHLRNIVHCLAPQPEPPSKPQPVCDPTIYLRDLLEKTAYIDIRGLQVGKGKANRFPIEDLFISLTTARMPAHEDGEAKKPRRKRQDLELEAEFAGREERAVPLHTALQNDRLVIIGDPGAGKTTFLRRVAHTLCQTRVGEVSNAAQERLGIADRTFPVFVKLSELAQHLLRQGNHVTAPADSDSAAWIPHYLAAVSQADNWGLDGHFFRQQLEAGLCTVLLDGLDEAPDRVVRERLSLLIENAVKTYRGCRFVITSRPAGYTSEIVLPEFAHAQIDPLSDEAVETFLSRWCQALYVESHAAADEHCGELLTALRARPDIRRMARNPVMLTALAVVHWNERRLPEQRADLYESIIRWLSRSREQKPGREKADRTVELLRDLALSMQNHPDGMQTLVRKRWAAEELATVWADGPVDQKEIGRAEAFLDAEELDSGIIVGRGNQVQFWHRTFQEYLAARAIAAQTEADQQAVLWGPPVRLYVPEWREVVLLLAGVLYQQGREKADNFVHAMLDRVGSNASLADQARCAGLLGAVFRDLAPVDYEPPRAKYHELLDAAMAIFDPVQSLKVPVEERIAAADALGQAGDPRLDHGRDDYWVTIPAGKFLMGAQSKTPKKPNYDKEAGASESPVHEVYLEEFHIARYPVTVGQYRKFVEDEGYEDKRWWEQEVFGKFSKPADWDEQLQYPSRPVVSVSWYEAAAYCEWGGFRLMTEAEWERAAQGTENRKYPWGSEDADAQRLNYARGEFPNQTPNIGHPTPVGIYPQGNTPEGIGDMAGNVWEWCADWYGEYTDESVSNPCGPKKAALRVFRGGSWLGDARYCRAAFRSWGGPEYRYSFLGFRVAAVPPGGQPSPVK